MKFAEILIVDLAALSGSLERQPEVALREVFADPLLGADEVPEAEVGELAGASPIAARAQLALYRAWRVAREDAGGIALPFGRRVLLPNEEARDFFDDHVNHFPEPEAAAEEIAAELGASPHETNHAIAERLRRRHLLTVMVQPLAGALRRYDPAGRRLALSETLPRESRGFRMAFQLALPESREVVEGILRAAATSSPEAAMLIRIGLLNYFAVALLMPFAPFLASAKALRHDATTLAARFGVSYEQACQRLSSLRRQGARGIPFFFLRVDPAGNVSKRFSASGIAFARYGGSGPRWVVHTAFARPGEVQVQSYPMGRRFSVLRVLSRHPPRVGASRGQRMSWPWAALPATRRRLYTQTGLIASRQRWGSGCRAGCATGRIAAAALSRRSSTGWRSIR